MSTQALFTHLPLEEELSPDMLLTELVHSLTQTGVQVTFRWTEGRQIRILDVQVQHEGNWHNVLDASFNTSSGAETFFLGDYHPEAVLTLAFVVKAVTAVPKMVVLISEQTPPLAVQVAPSPPQMKKLDAGEPWEEEDLSYTVSEGPAVV